MEIHCTAVHEIVDRPRARRASARILCVASLLTGLAAGQPLDVVLGDEPFTDVVLNGRRLIGHGEDFGPWPHVLFGVAMAVEAPLQLERLRLPHQRHAIDRTVTGCAADTLVDV